MGKHDSELFSGFALNALSQAERDEVLQRAAIDDTNGQEINSLQQTAAYLGLTVPEIQPPPKIKANVMDAIRTVEQVPANVAETLSEGLTTQSRALSYPVDEPTESRQGVRKKSQKFFALAVGMLLVTSGGLGAMVWNLNTQQQQMSTLIQAVKSERDTMMQILSAPDMQSKSQTLDDGATIRLSYSAESGAMAVITHSMPELPEGKGYELWLISAEKATPAGMLDLSNASATAMITGSMEGITHFGITVEPATGSQTPTTEPILLQSL
ncbi:anti-sigma factor domain-containing protein [Glutamicibacter sp. NPDC087344]|uniref:anti-sigma factor n=1 Tax=Glutamicibacter sp. NPDC087344 TaxID=3363994 RepID=UPI0037F719AA